VEDVARAEETAKEAGRVRGGELRPRAGQVNSQADTDRARGRRRRGRSAPQSDPPAPVPDRSARPASAAVGGGKVDRRPPVAPYTIAAEPISGCAFMKPTIRST
jgi:hypothetical protein